HLPGRGASPPEIPPAVLSAAEMAARRLGLAALSFRVADVPAFEPAFRAARSEGVGAIHVLRSPFFDVQRRKLIELAASYRLPAVYELNESGENGARMSCGPTITERSRGCGSHVDRILKGARPGDLPIERSTTFEFAITLKTAKALVLPIPPSVLARADEIVQ